MKRVSALILCLLLLTALAACGSDSAPAEEPATQAAAEPTVIPTLPPADADSRIVFDKTYGIDENTLVLTAYETAQGTYLTADFTYDAEKPSISSLLYITAYAACSQRADMLDGFDLSTHSSDGSDTGRIVSGGGSILLEQHPAVYDPDYDAEADETLDEELFLADYYAILGAFNELDAALTAETGTSTTE